MISHAEPRGRRSIASGFPVLAALALLSVACRAPALEFSRGDLHGSLDTTLSYGSSWRTESPNPRLICTANGGTAYGCNADDGDLNYGKGLTSAVGRFTSELQLDYKNVGGFARMTGFYDVVNQHLDRKRTPLSADAKDLVGSDVNVLDFFGWGRFKVGDHPGEVRLGKQVLSWGESTFIPNSINTINPVDVSKLRSPGSELRDALLPIPMVVGNVGLTQNLSAEGFYELDWDKVTLDPTGSYFSTNDFVATGGRKVVLGFGDISDQGRDLSGLTPFAPLIPTVNTGVNPNFLSVRRAPDRSPSNSGQWGISLRAFAPSLNDTEFGFYFMNYHSRLPVVSAVTGTASGVANAASVATALTPFAAVIGGGSAAAGAQTIGAVALDQYTRTARYVVEYPKNIKLFGASFNTQLGTTGWALQGEFSHRLDVPLQVDDVELLFAALTPVSFINPAYTVNQVGTFGTGTYIPGYIRRDVSQWQFTGTKVFSHILGTSQTALVGEVAVQHVWNMPDKSTLRLDEPGTFTSGNPFQATAAGAHPGKAAVGASHFADDTSWGYRILARFEYLNAIGPISLTPSISWQHDVSGNSPQPIGPFLEGRKAVSLGLTASYLEQWSANVGYTRYFGAGRYNLLSDRDYVSASVKYSF